MPVIIDEVTTEAIKPAAPPRLLQPVTEVPADSENEFRKILGAVRRAEARAERLRAD